MDLHDAFDRALPSRQWASMARRGTLVAFIAADAWSPWIPAALAMLQPDERERVQRKRRTADRDLVTLAYACHRLVLASVLECHPREVAVQRDAVGCPVVADGSVRTSLSHAEGLVAIAVSCTGSVGIDIEPASRAAGLPEIAGRVCHPRELAGLSGLPEPARARALLSLWVRKEALLKAAGIGLAVEMDRFEAPVGHALAFPGGTPGSATLHLFDGDDHFVAALAGPPGEIAHAWLSP